MSENLIHVPVAAEIEALARSAEADCFDFQHQILNSTSTFTGPGDVLLFTLNIPENSAFVMTTLDIKMLFDTEDTDLDYADFRSTFDLNPYGPLFTGSGGPGTVFILDNGQLVFNPCNDIGIINANVILVFSGGHQITIFCDPRQPALKVLFSVNRIIGYSVPQSVGTTLKKKESRIRTGEGATNLINL